MGSILGLETKILQAAWPKGKQQQQLRTKPFLEVYLLALFFFLYLTQANSELNLSEPQFPPSVKVPSLVHALCTPSVCLLALKTGRTAQLKSAGR